MVSIVTRKTSHVAPSAFKLYAGDEPPPGAYRGILKFVNMVKSSGDNLMFKPVIELKAAAGSAKANWDGYPCFPMVVLTDDESNQQKEQSFYQAIGAPLDPKIQTEGDPKKFKAGDGQKTKVLKIGNIKPEDIVVNVSLRMENDNREDHKGERQLKCDLIFASRDNGGLSTDEEDEEADVEVEEGDDEELVAYEEDDLMEMGLPALRKILTDEFDYEVADAKAIKKKSELVAAILEAQEEDEDDDDDDEDDDDEEDESDEDEDEEDEEEDDPAAQARADAEEMDRSQLKAAITKRAPGTKFKTSQKDEDLVEILIPLLMKDPPF